MKVYLYATSCLIFYLLFIYWALYLAKGMQAPGVDDMAFVLGASSLFVYHYETFNKLSKHENK